MGYLDQLLGLVGLYDKPQPPVPLPGPMTGPGREQGPGSLPGPKTRFDPIPTEGPKLTQYPTSQDAQAARAGGFGYGEPYSAYVEGTAGRIFGDKKGPMPMEGRGGLSPFAMVDPNLGFEQAKKTPTTQNVPSPYKENLQDNLTRAALATNYSPVAAVGFDPRHITTDVTGKSNLQALGLTDPTTGEIMSSSPPPGSSRSTVGEGYNASTVLHESIHRGLVQLLNNPRLAALIPAHLRDRMDPYNDEDHEALVYQLMAKQAGDPDTPAGSGERKFAGAQWKPEEIDILNKLAQEAIRQRRPYGGPR